MLGQDAAPELQGNVAGPDANARAFHEPELGLDPHHDHRSRRCWIVPRNERLIDPPAGQGQPIGQPAEDLHDFRLSFRLHAGNLTSL